MPDEPVHSTNQCSTATTVEKFELVLMCDVSPADLREAEQLVRRIESSLSRQAPGGGNVPSSLVDEMRRIPPRGTSAQTREQTIQVASQLYRHGLISEETFNSIRTIMEDSKASRDQLELARQTILQEFALHRLERVDALTRFRQDLLKNGTSPGEMAALIEVAANEKLISKEFVTKAKFLLGLLSDSDPKVALGSYIDAMEREGRIPPDKIRLIKELFEKGDYKQAISQILAAELNEELWLTLDETTQELSKSVERFGTLSTDVSGRVPNSFVTRVSGAGSGGIVAFVPPPSTSTPSYSPPPFTSTPLSRGNAAVAFISPGSDEFLPPGIEKGSIEYYFWLGANAVAAREKEKKEVAAVQAEADAQVRSDKASLTAALVAEGQRLGKDVSPIDLAFVNPDHTSLAELKLQLGLTADVRSRQELQEEASQRDTQPQESSTQAKDGADVKQNQGPQESQSTGAAHSEASAGSPH